MTDKEWELQHQAYLEADESCCRNCSKKYWEICTGISMYLGRVEGCKKALDKYTERYNKKLKY